MTKMISSEIPDWSREKLSICEWSPGKRLISSIRSYQKYKKKDYGQSQSLSLPYCVIESGQQSAEQISLLTATSLAAC